MDLFANQPIDANTFLTEYWQKRPYLFRGALPAGYELPFDIDEYAGLACEEMVESRFVLEENGGYSALTGPFSEEDVVNHSKERFSLLLHALDQWFPEINELLTLVDFIPSWRIDDIMASLSPEGCSVGPHLDHYDVFLIQGMGGKAWQIGPPLADPQLDSRSDLKILSNFTPSETLTLEEGDILYLPSGWQHWGKAIGTSLTLSIGFRAPAVSDLLDTLLEQALYDKAPAFYTDPDGLAANGGEIPSEVIDAVEQLLKSQLDRESIATAFGSLVTTPRYAEFTISEEADEPAKGLYRNPHSRFAWHEMTLFIDGESIPFHKETLPLVEALCNESTYTYPYLQQLAVNKEASALLEQLIARGKLLTSE